MEEASKMDGVSRRLSSSDALCPSDAVLGFPYDETTEEEVVILF